MILSKEIKLFVQGGELFGNKRKRKAAWEDEEDSKVLVKDVTATYKKAIGKHGQQASAWVYFDFNDG